MLTLIKHCHHSLKGFAAVAGIISILILQLAFTVFLKTSALFAESDVLVRNAKVAMYPVGLPMHNVVASVPTNEFTGSDAIGDRVVSLTRPQFRAETASFHKNAAVRRNRSARSGRKPPRLTPKVVFSDTIIEIGTIAVKTRPSRPMREVSKENPVMVTPKPVIIETKPDKRSFVASVLPIVKKPYGWMKAIGSKIF